MLDSIDKQQAQSQPVDTTKVRPVVSYAKTDFSVSGKGALAGGVVGFGYAVVAGKSKIMWTIVGAAIGVAIEKVITTLKQ
jgi:hypothetical protein